MKNLQTIIIGIFTILIIGAATANAANWTVTKATNSNDNVCDADCSLREAVFKADSGDTVIFSPNLVGQTITLGGSHIVITKRITIDGFLNDPNVAFISGNNTSRHFFIQEGAGLILKNMTLVQGNGAAFVGEPAVRAGGAILGAQFAPLSLDRVSIRGNKAIFGGAVYLNRGTYHITNSSFTGNSAESSPAIAIYSDATLYMSNTTVSGNFTYLGDGNTFGGGAVTIVGSNLIVRNSTIFNNSARRGGGITVGATSSTNTIDIGNTIVAGNTATESGQDIFAITDLMITSRGGNLIQNLETVPDGIFNKPNDITGVNPLLGPLNFYGGFPVQSHSLQAGSPARNGGINANAVDPLTNQPLLTDTRGAGFPRIADTTVDIGAFEDQSGNTSLIVTKNADTNDLVCDTDCSLREAVFTAGLNSGTDTITFAPNVFGTLALGGSEIEIKNQNVNIVGYPTLNAETLIVSGGNANRIFYLVNATVNISGMTLANGNAGGGFGGAIRTENNSNLTLDKVIVRNNFADRGGAIFIGPSGTGHITNSTINNNSANVVLAIEVTNGSTLNMANTTVSTNFDANGGPGPGAVFVVGTANIRNSTIAFNRTSGGTGGGIFSIGTLNIGNSIVANNIAATSPDIHRSSGVITSVGGNLVQNTNGFPAGTFSQTNDVVGVDPLLAALADNGGNVTTHSLMPNSPAINTGINANAVDPFDNSILVTDARGTAGRISNVTVDKGAFEAFAPTAAAVSVSGRVTNGKRGVARARVYMTGQNGETQTTITNSFGYFRFS
ncbi:MAG: choice-of-anchor Q domain-containing protein, partial [Pyrinomonadaceae bacterium]